MLSNLYNERPEFRTPEVLAAAKGGLDFLRSFALRPDNRVYFCLAQDGKVS